MYTIWPFGSDVCRFCKGSSHTGHCCHVSRISDKKQTSVKNGQKVQNSYMYNSKMQKFSSGTLKLSVKTLKGKNGYQRIKFENGPNIIVTSNTASTPSKAFVSKSL